MSQAEVGASVRIETLDRSYQIGMENVRGAVRRQGTDWQRQTAIGKDGRRRVRHVEVEGPITFIPEEAEAATSGLRAFGIVLIVLGVITVGAAFGFSGSVPEFPSAAVLPMVAGGGVVFLIGIGLQLLHRSVTRRRERELPLDGVYLFEDALIDRKGDKARVFPRDSIVEIVVYTAVAGSSNAAGGPGGTVTFYRSQLNYRKGDGTEDRHILDMYRYSIFPDPPMNPILEEWLRAERME
jgi:hypothetical protein